MPKEVDYKCSACNRIFTFMHHPVDEPPPDHCLLCNALIDGEPEKVPVLRLNMRTKHSIVPDKVYRDMEVASEARAADAAEMLGADKADMSSLKITDMKDNTREGDQNAITRQATEAMKRLSTPTAAPTMQGAGSGWGSADVAGPGSGSTRAFINQSQGSGQFGQIAQAVTAKGQMAKHVVTKS